MEKKKDTGTKLKSSQLLRESLLDAEKLLAHAAEYGIRISEKHIKAIVDAKAKEQLGNWTEQDEVDLWIAFQTLSKAVHPVTIDSIRASSIPAEPPTGLWATIFRIKKKRSLVKRSVNWYSSIALFSMVGMLILQIYALQGTKYLANLESGNARMVEIETRIQQLALVPSDERTLMMEQSHLENEIIQKIQEVESNVELLSNWLDLTYNIWSKATEEVGKAVQDKRDFDDGPPGFAAPNNTTQNIVVIQQGKSLLIILNQYILPLLYGLLGGFAFVLRSIATETKSMTYTAVSNIKYGLRIHLGALAGLVIGFLWGDISSSQLGMIQSFSPLAVAFIAGYSVEFMFKLVDSLIGSTEKKVTGGDSTEGTNKAD
ncbi:MAG: hypothetical protein B6I20_03940 [Bacteroidetes bacterium 4572_117]|nr:MAG: hypothetical protein B6I20_03940 [Bacteroidetes bacterium 4572_117]